MFHSNTKFRLLFLFGIFIGSIGAIGQAYLLYHELADCYPYKMMDVNLYENIGNVGIYFAPSLATIIGFLFGRKKLWLTPIIPVFLSPLVFVGVFNTISLMNKLNGFTNDGIFFDETTPAMAMENFSKYSISLSFAGLIIGAIFSFILFQLSKPKKLS